MGHDAINALAICTKEIDEAYDESKELNLEPNNIK
jgi:hypothetical protein